VVLDLSGTPGAGSNPSVLPTQLSWTYDSNASAAATRHPAIHPGDGTLTIKWIPDAHPLAGTMGSGKMIVKFVGSSISAGR